jgi:dihydroneopterin triphosphate diphosphatase
MDAAAPRRFKIPRSVLVVVYTPALDVLLIERADHPGYWQSVTGAKDRARESYAATAAREVGEETGICLAAARPGGLGSSTPQAHPLEGEGDPVLPLSNLSDWRLVNRYDIYPQWQHRYAPGVTRNTERVFGLVVPAGTPVRLAPREHLSFKWLPWREAADACFSPSNAEAILQLPRLART